MDPKQLELDLRPKESTRTAELKTGLVVDLQRARGLKKQQETEQLFRAIINSVSHVSPPEQKFK